MTALDLHCSAQASSSCSAQAPRCGGFSRCGARAAGAWAPVVAARRLSRPRACGSQTRGGAHVPCVGRQVPILCSARTSSPSALSRAHCRPFCCCSRLGACGGLLCRLCAITQTHARKLECWPQALAVMENTSGNILICVFGYTHTHAHLSVEVEHAIFTSRRKFQTAFQNFTQK